MIVLGLNAFHGDSSACLLVSGKLVAAAEEERFCRVKHWAGFPAKAIEFCLKHQGLKLSDIDVIAINSDNRAARVDKIKFLLSGQASWPLVKEKLLLRSKRKGIQQYLSDLFPDSEFKGKVEYVEHHLAHLSSAYHVSPFDQASVVSIDGFGDFASVAWGLAVNGDIEVQKRIKFPHSLGIFYQAMTQYLGFPHYGDEYKVMGLAPYGQPLFKEQMDEIVSSEDNGEFRLNLDYFNHHRQSAGFTWDDGAPQMNAIFNAEKMATLFGELRTKQQPLKEHHYNIARSVQDAYERHFFRLLNHVNKEHGLHQLALAGGCAMNSVANGKIHLQTLFKNTYVQSAAGDAGGAIGAAMIASQRYGCSLFSEMQHSYFGPSFDENSIAELLEKQQEKLNSENCIITKSDSEEILVDKVSNYLIQGKVVGWFQGAMEWGPRALGNRSILGDPRRADMKDILNNKIKRRESFRPFAPSILREQVVNWFESDDEVPFMMKVFQIKEPKRKKIPAVTHVDGSGRLQTVAKQSNPLYYKLIDSFYQKTQVPMLLNTSFNENEPVVCRPEEALACFLRTKMDVLVLGSYVVRRSDNE